MTKRNEAKYKIDRRLGVNLWGRSKSPLNSRSYGPGQHGQRRAGKPSDYGIQLKAKQKIRGYYGNIGEKQFRNIFAEASRRKGDTVEHLIGLLESRLDSVVYRMKLAITMFAARQLINHGHITVNGKKVDIASYKVSEGDVIEVRQRSKDMVVIAESLQNQERDVPDYISIDDNKGVKATFLRVPSFSDVPYPVQMEPNLVVEFYSR